MSRGDAGPIRLVLIILILCGTALVSSDTSNFWQKYKTSATGRTCSYPGAMPKIQETAKKYPNPEILIVTEEEKHQIQEQIKAWNTQKKQPRLGLDPCSTCDSRYTACILYKLYEGTVTDTGEGDKKEEKKPPVLKGEITKTEPKEGICARYAKAVNPLEGRLHVVPKTAQGPRYYCYVSFPNWKLLGEDGNYCCYFGPYESDTVPPPVLKPDTPKKDKVPPGDHPPPPLQTRIKVKNICDLRQLAVWVFERYDSRVGPISTVRISNAQQPTYLIMLSGMQVHKLGQPTTELDALIAWLNVQALDAYLASILDAVRTLPRGANLILAGHSQGGMEAENAVGPLRAMGFNVLQVITYGSPVSSMREGGTNYLYVRAMHDPVPMLDKQYAFSRDFVIIPGGTDPNPFSSPNGSHHIYPDSQYLSGRQLPPIPLLRTRCLELDLRTIQEYRALPNFYRIFGMPPGSYPSDVSESPRNPGQCRRNCFWVSLAQDKYYAAGDADMRYWAECEPEPIPDEDIPVILKRWYGARALDDLHGPDAAAGIQRHRTGTMVLSSKQAIEAALGTAGPGSRGLVFWKAHPQERIGHVFNVRNHNNTIRFWDAQSPCDWGGMFAPGTQIYFYRTH